MRCYLLVVRGIARFSLSPIFHRFSNTETHDVIRNLQPYDGNAVVLVMGVAFGLRFI
jgi:hypothetical protein